MPQFQFSPLTFHSRLDLLNSALALQNDVDSRKKRAKSSTKQKKKPKRDKSKADKSGGSSAYHFIAFVPIGQQVWQLDGLTPTPVCIGKLYPVLPASSAPLTPRQGDTMRTNTGPRSCAPSSRSE